MGIEAVAVVISDEESGACCALEESLWPLLTERTAHLFAWAMVTGMVRDTSFQRLFNLLFLLFAFNFCSLPTKASMANNSAVWRSNEVIVIVR